MRKEGYYWVMYDGDWFIGEYDGVDSSGKDFWYLCGFPVFFYETELDKIDELMIPKHN